MSQTFKFIKADRFLSQSIILSVGFEGESMSLDWYGIGQGYNTGSGLPDVIYPIPDGPLRLLVWSDLAKQVFVRHSDAPSGLGTNDPQTTETIDVAAGQMLTKILIPKRAYMLVILPEELGGQIEALGGVNRGPSTMRIKGDPLIRELA